MTQFYYVSLKLTCDRRTTAATEGLAERWSRRLERRWSGMSFALGAPIEAALNAEVLRRCVLDLKRDLGIVPTAVEALQPGAWVVDPAGGYVQSAEVLVRTPLGEPRAWTFVDLEGREATLSIFAQFDLITL